MKNQSHQAEHWMQAAAQVATGALCSRARCGSVIVKNNKIIGSGFNAPPLNQVESQRCHIPKSTTGKPGYDQTCCLHAEWRAIMDALKNEGVDLLDADLYFARIDTDGNITPCGPVVCTVCSRLALDAGIKQFYVKNSRGIKTYSTSEYNNLAYEYKHIK
jgi:deoxycytidylate deaminase